MTNTEEGVVFSRKAIRNIFDQKKHFVIIGLTGRLGSGCSTVSKILSDKSLDLKLPGGSLDGLDNDTERDQRVIFRFTQKHWKPFTIIRIRTIITAFIICMDTKLLDLNELVKKISEKEKSFSLEEIIKGYYECIDTYKKAISEKIAEARIAETNEDIVNPINDDTSNKSNKSSKEAENEIDDIIKNNFIKNSTLDIENIKNQLSIPLGKVEDYKESFSVEKLVLYYVLLPAIADCIHNNLELKNHLYTKLFQRIGNNIRAWGKIGDPPSTGSIDTHHVFDIAKYLNYMIKVLRHPLGISSTSPARVVIDSFKNLFEVTYMRDRYNAFYLMAISREEKERQKKLKDKKQEFMEEIDLNEQSNTARKIYVFFKKQVDVYFKSDSTIIFDKISDEDQFKDFCMRNTSGDKHRAEENLKWFVDAWQNEGYDFTKLMYCKNVENDIVRENSYLNQWQTFLIQDVEKCIQSADIFITTDETDKGKFLFRHTLARYISLIFHPAIVLPTPIERCMQIAQTAKINSGCLSRQVGAVVTDKNYNILSLGWNDVPCGQVTCIRRNLFDIQSFYDKKAYSDYELENSDFRSYIDKFKIDTAAEKKELLEGLPAAFCFKDFYQGMIRERDQIYTRSLHAEEKALANCNKSDTMSGYLFTTSSPCELCAKKAKDYKISKIYYIEQYPGISLSNIFNSGDVGNRAVYELFVGAIGLGYSKLYTPLMPYKDELKLRGFPKKKNSNDD